MRGIFQRAAVERDQALVAAAVRALVDGHGEMALAEQRAGIGFAFRDQRRGRRPLPKRAPGPHLAGRGEIHHEQADRAVGLGPAE